MQIRQARTEEYDAIYSLVQVAFQTARVSDGTEQDFVLELRRRIGYRPELELVAVEGTRLVGHIMFTELDVAESVKEVKGLMLAPLCVALEYRGTGVGRELVEQGFRLARSLGYTAAFLIGDPAYYSRFGFRQAATFGIRNALPDLPDQYVLACALTEHALDGVGGCVTLE